MNESIRNILQALYEESTVIKRYVDTVAQGEPVPYTILVTSEEIQKNQRIVDNVIALLENDFPFTNNTPKTWFAEIHALIPEHPIPEWAFEEWPELLKVMKEDINKNVEFECIMFKDDAIVSGSRQIVSDPNKIEMLKNYAKIHGYTISLKEVKK